MRVTSSLATSRYPKRRAVLITTKELSYTKAYFRVSIFQPMFLSFIYRQTET
jgi:hypothetical protein